MSYVEKKKAERVVEKCFTDERLLFGFSPKYVFRNEVMRLGNMPVFFLKTFKDWRWSSYPHFNFGGRTYSSFGEENKSSCSAKICTSFSSISTSQIVAYLLFCLATRGQKTAAVSGSLPACVVTFGSPFHSSFGIIRAAVRLPACTFRHLGRLYSSTVPSCSMFSVGSYCLFKTVLYTQY